MDPEDPVEYFNRQAVALQADLDNAQQNRESQQSSALADSLIEKHNQNSNANQAA